MDKSMQLMAVCSAMTFCAMGAQAAELVVNGGFETGTFSGWTQTGDPDFGDVAMAVGHSGVDGALFGPIGEMAGISQSLATVAGTTYNYSFWLQNAGGATDAFAWSLDGVAKYPGMTDAAAFGYREFAGRFTATGSTTTIAFGFRNDPGFWYLDDVSVAAVPEASPPALLAAGLLCMTALELVRQRRGPDRR